MLLLYVKENAIKHHKNEYQSKRSTNFVEWSNIFLKTEIIIMLLNFCL